VNNILQFFFKERIILHKNLKNIHFIGLPTSIPWCLGCYSISFRFTIGLSCAYTCGLAVLAFWLEREVFYLIVSKGNPFAFLKKYIYKEKSIASSS
jgi:hypothetical protein